MKRHSCPFTAGFTILEIIIVIVVLAILTASVSYRYFSTSETGSRAAVDQVVADIQYVQVLASATVAQKTISFSASSNQYTLSAHGAGTETKSLPGGVTADNTVSFTFNSLGEKTGGDGTVSIGGRVITVYGITGKVTG